MPISYEHYLHKFDNVQTSYEHCVKKISELKSSKEYYIGVSKDPTERLLNHIKEKNMNNMFLLCVTPTKPNAEAIEDGLLKKFGNNKKCINDLQDGGSGITSGINYIYIIFH